MDPDFLLSEEETLEFYKSYKGLKKAGYPIVSSDVAVEYVDKWPLGRKTTIYKKDLPDVPKDSYYPCSLGRTQCFISADGNVYPCSKKWGYGINIRDGGFTKEVYHVDNVARGSSGICRIADVLNGHLEWSLGFGRREFGSWV